MRKVRWPHETIHRRQWKEAAHATRDEWQACYEQRPSEDGRLVEALAAALVPHEDDDIGDAVAAC